MNEIENMPMRRSLGWLAIIAMSGVSTLTWAGEPPTPRASIGPTPIIREMIPAAANPLHQVLQSTAADRIRIVSIADQQLFISYWDGDAWRQEIVEAKKFKDISCPKCADTITIAFNDGKDTKSVKVRTGTTYLLGWSEQAGAWVLTSSTNR